MLNASFLVNLLRNIKLRIHVTAVERMGRKRLQETKGYIKTIYINESEVKDRTNLISVLLTCSVKQHLVYQLGVQKPTLLPRVNNLWFSHHSKDHYVKLRASA